MLLSEDFVFGGTPHALVKDNVYDKCACDGQFSEADLCRGDDEVFEFADPRVLHTCYDTTPFRFQLVFHSKPPKIDWLCGSDPRPRFIQYQIAGHAGVQAEPAMKLFESFLAELAMVRVKCPFKVVIFFSGMHAQDPSLDVRFPHQSRSAGLAYNAKAHPWAESLGVTVIDWFNMTLNGPTPDGFHSLSDVSLLKAAHLIRLGGLALDEGHFYEKK